MYFKKFVSDPPISIFALTTLVFSATLTKEFCAQKGVFGVDFLKRPRNARIFYALFAL